MKNIITARIAPLFGLIALVALIGFSMTACGGDSELLPPDPTSAIFESKDASGNIYILAINVTEPASSSIRAAYTPKAGNSYILTYISSANTLKSKGTVQSTNPITLQPTGSSSL